MSLTRILAAGVLAMAWSVPAPAQTQTQTPTQNPTPGQVSRSSQVKARMTIEAIDPKTRVLTLKNDKGETDTYTVGPDVKRFDELKVGDILNVTYSESVVMKLRKPGDPSMPSGTTATGAIGDKSKLPSAAVGAQTTTTVEVKSTDLQTGSITVETADGTTVTRKVKDKKNLDGVKAGDRLDITYTQAVLLAVERGK